LIRYSFIVPIYQDAGLAGAFCSSFETAFQDHLGISEIDAEVELIFVNDDGTEATSAILKEVCDEYGFAKFIELSRNFGQHVALSCGYRHASGSYVGMLNVDQEDPPDQIPKLLDALEGSTAELALSLRQGGRIPAFSNGSSRLFNWILNKATGYDVPLRVGTLRVMKRRPVELLNSLAERSRYLPGLEAWLGFRVVYVPTRQQPRTAGRSSYSFRRRLRMAFEAIISFSDLPLRFLVLLGAIISVVGFLLAGFLVLSALFFTAYQAGYPSTMAAIVFIGGLQISVVGLASLYIGRILTEVQRRPLYVVRNRYKIEAEREGGEA
jgi:glycosyltransferase involved in cell wall biosynthesis